MPTAPVAQSERGVRASGSQRAWLVAMLLVAAAVLATGLGSSATAASAAEPTATADVAASSPAELEKQAQARQQAGDFVAARVLYEQSAAGYAGSGDVPAEAIALRHSAESSLALGQPSRAIASLSRAMVLAQGSDRPALTAELSNSLGYAYGQVGRHREAQGLLEDSMAAAERSSDLPLLAAGANNLGNLLASQGRLQEASRQFERALEASTQIGDPALAARASANLARAALELGEQARASQLLDSAVALLQPLSASHQQAYSLISVGQLQARLAEQNAATATEAAASAHSTLTRAAVIATELGDTRAQSYAHGYLGSLYERSGRHAEALQLTQQAVFEAQRADAAEALYRWHWQTGRILRTQGDTEAAVLAYQEAVYYLESIRLDLNADLRSADLSFRDSVGPVYFELADLLLRQASGSNDPEQTARALLAARDTVEQVKGAELEDYFQDDCVAAFQSRSIGIESVGQRTAVIYPIVLPDRTELLLTLPDGLRQFRAPVDEATLTAEIRALRSKLEKRTTHEYYPHSRQLYEWLIEPLEAELTRQAIDTLVVIPDGPLRTIPIAALHDGSGFLVQRYALATTPGLTLTDPAPIERGGILVLANGLTEAVQGFSALPYVKSELATIKALYGGTVLENQEFVRANLERQIAAEPFSIVHIASHGQFRSDVDDTFLLTYDGRIGMDALEQIISSTRYRSEAVELLALSACETAVGDDRAALGLAGVAVKAGARSALATLWTVNDPAAAALVAEFYRRLQDPSLSKAEALQAAQLSLVNDRRYWHPSTWSPFLLIGNWL